MFKRKICACVLMMFFAAPLALATSIDITLDSLADICGALESSILDVVVEYETYNDPPPKLEDIAGTDNVVQKGRAKHVLTAARPFMERFKSTKKVTVMNEYEDSWDSETANSYNGKVAKRCQIDGWPNRLSMGTIIKNQDFVPKYTITPLGFTILRFEFEGKPLSERLREKEFVRLDNTIKTVNGFETIHVDLFVHWEDKEILYARVHFSVAHFLTPVKIEYFNGRKVALAVEVFELEEVPETLWFPKRGRLTPSVGRAYVYEASKIVVNQGLTEKDFDIDFPASTKVRDEIKGIEYVVQPVQ